MSATSAPADLTATIRESFPRVVGHLDAATTGVPPLTSAQATRDAVEDWAHGRVDGVRCDDDVERSRAAFARIIGVHTDEVACANAVSVFAGLVAASVPAGGEILCARGDFTSVVFPMLAQTQRGVRVREVELSELCEAIDARTSLVAVSAVQSADGRVCDLDALHRAADHHGADVFLDVTQAAGWLAIDGTRFSYVCAGAYKWLLSPRGTALMRVAPEAAQRLIPHTAGWYAGSDPWACCYGGPLRLADSAKRFDVSPAWVCWAGTAPSLELVAQLGCEAIAAHDLSLAARLRDGLGMAPSDSAIVIADHPDAAQRLARAGVRASVRAGKVRLSCHLPATTADVDRAIDALT